MRILQNYKIRKRFKAIHKKYNDLEKSYKELYSMYYNLQNWIKVNKTIENNLDSEIPGLTKETLYKIWNVKS